MFVCARVIFWYLFFLLTGVTQTNILLTYHLFTPFTSICMYLYTMYIFKTQFGVVCIVRPMQWTNERTHRKSHHGYCFIETEALLFGSAIAVMETNETFTRIESMLHICAYIVHDDKLDCFSPKYIHTHTHVLTLIEFRNFSLFTLYGFFSVGMTRFI